VNAYSNTKGLRRRNSYPKTNLHETRRDRVCLLSSSTLSSLRVGAGPIKTFWSTQKRIFRSIIPKNPGTDFTNHNVQEKVAKVLEDAMHDQTKLSLSPKRLMTGPPRCNTRKTFKNIPRAVLTKCSTTARFVGLCAATNAYAIQRAQLEEHVSFRDSDDMAAALKPYEGTDLV
jgi:hypothetical protein